MAERKKSASPQKTHRAGFEGRGVIWPNPGSESGKTSFGKNISDRSRRVIATTSADLSGALWRLADK
jgi:hypothetical protein